MNSSDEGIAAMIAKLIDKVNKGNLKQKVDAFGVGDLVNVNVRIREGGKERVQSYSGTVIARRGRGAEETFTVRRISYGVGVERIFAVHSPNVVDVRVEKRGDERRAKLYFLRGVGRKSKTGEQESGGQA